MPSISLPAATLAAGAIGGAASLGTGIMNANAVGAASKAQQSAEQQALALQGRMFDQTQANLSPFIQGGQGALNKELELLGIGQAGAPNFAAYVQGNPDLMAAYQQNGGGQSIADWGQQHWRQFGQNEGRQVTPFSGQGPSGDPSQMQGSAIDALKTNPLYLAETGVGDQAILSNASATGGLRSGNTNYNLAGLHAQTLAQVYQQMLGNLSGVAGMGANAAGGLGSLGANFAGLGTSTLGNLGSAQAGGILGSTGAMGGGINNGLSQLLSGLSMSKILGGFGGASQLGAPAVQPGGELDGLF